MSEQPNLFVRAEALGIYTVQNDYSKLLDAIHEREGELMILRHDVQRRMAGIIRAVKVD